MGCERWLGQRAPQTAAAILRGAADDARPDRYGDGDVLQEFEAWMTSMLGTEAAALFPSGTMAQQIALPIHCDRRGLDTVAYHPTCHLELHEHGGPAHLHGLKAELVGQRDRPLTREDLEGVQARIGALLIELPQREIVCRQRPRRPRGRDLRSQGLAPPPRRHPVQPVSGRRRGPAGAR